MIDILLLEDSDLDAELIAGHLRKGDIAHRITRVTSGEEFLKALSGSSRFDLILADFCLPGFDGLSALKIAHEMAPDIPFIFVSGTLGEEIAIESFKRGATDYVLKQRLVRLPSAVTRALAEARAKAEHRLAEMHLRLIVSELSHRVNNTVAVIQSIASQTLRTAESLADFKESFLSRLLSLGRTHELLTRTNWVGAPLEDVVLAELEPYHATPQRGCRIGGPHVQLPPGPALTLAMIFHELATNAAKHGSLSRAEGRVHVEWRWLREGVGPMLCLTWTEEGGPAVTKPTRRGFGSRLLEQSVKGLGGTVRLDYAPDGLRAEIRTPLDSSPSAQLAPTGVNVHLSIRKTASALP